MKKSIKIVGHVMLWIFGILLIAELAAYILALRNANIPQTIKRRWYDNLIMKSRGPFGLVFPRYLLDERDFDDYFSPSKFRPRIRGTGRPIAAFGCSFTYGSGIQTNETWPAQLAEITKRPIYNYGFPGAGAQHMLYFLEHDYTHGLNKNPPEYIIYMFLMGHPKRNRSIFGIGINHQAEIYLRKSPRTLSYKLGRDGVLRQRKTIPLLKSSFFFSHLANAINGRPLSDWDVFMEKKIFLRIHEIIKEQFPDSKFIIVSYDPISGDEKIQKMFDELGSEGIHVFDLSAIIGDNLRQEKYMQPNDHTHPGPNTYKDIVAPIIARELGLL